MKRTGHSVLSKNRLLVPEFEYYEWDTVEDFVPRGCDRAVFLGLWRGAVLMSRLS
jgi:hypothetical protein